MGLRSWKLFWWVVQFIHANCIISFLKNETVAQTWKRVIKLTEFTNSSCYRAIVNEIASWKCKIISELWSFEEEKQNDMRAWKKTALYRIIKIGTSETGEIKKTDSLSCALFFSLRIRGYRKMLSVYFLVSRYEVEILFVREMQRVNRMKRSNTALFVVKSIKFNVITSIIIIMIQHFHK